jgi:hypothetical protein
MLYVKGMTMTIAAGGAVRDSRESFFTNEANRVAGRCLRKISAFKLGKTEVRRGRTLNSGKALLVGRTLTDV